MVRQIALRQRIRKGLLLFSFLLFPLFMNFLSPYVIIDGASQGIVNGSLIVFSLMFLSALFVGRAWCGWLCPMGGLCELSNPINDRLVNGKKIDWIKWAIWVPWIALIVWMVVQAGGYHSFDPFLDTVDGISVAGTPDRPIFIAYIIYYAVIGLFLILSLTVGRRGACHSICWMAPFMILGRGARNQGNWPALRLVASPDQCTNCMKCTTGCPMSLDVNGLVHSGQMEHRECILCGTCVDNCNQHAIRYTFSAGK